MSIYRLLRQKISPTFHHRLADYQL